jgi:hypothetical protein
MIAGRAQLGCSVKGETVVVSKVAVMRFAGNDDLSLNRALETIGGMNDLNERPGETRAKALAQM